MFSNWTILTDSSRPLSQEVWHHWRLAAQKNTVEEGKIKQMGNGRPVPRQSRNTHWDRNHFIFLYATIVYYIFIYLKFIHSRWYEMSLSKSKSHQVLFPQVLIYFIFISYLFRQQSVIIIMKTMQVCCVSREGGCSFEYFPYPRGCVLLPN